MHGLFENRRYLIPFRARLLPQIFCDTLVIGAGIAGLRAALAAAEHGEVILLLKAGLDKSSTAWAQGGIAAVLGNPPSQDGTFDGTDNSYDSDNLESHIQDTIKTGRGLCNEEIVRKVVLSAHARIEEMQQWGMKFDLDESGRRARTREGGHKHKRVLHSGGDATGQEVVRCLGERVKQNPAIRLFDNCFALDLLTNNNGCDSEVPGAITHHHKYGLQVIWSHATILATGGAGQVYRETTNPAVCTGDGLAMAYRAGAQLADMSFVQFHPTTLYIAGSERTLISEAVRGEGAYIVDKKNNRIMLNKHEMAELAPRDIVSRTIIQHLVMTGETHVFLDARHFKPGFFAKRFPVIISKLAPFGINPEKDLIPVHPSAHYTIGGIWVDDAGRTNLPRLYACGETAYTGLHGSNRLASNSLLEGLVFGEITGRVCKECHDINNQKQNQSQLSRLIVSEIPKSERGELDLVDVKSSLRSVMWRHLGVIRDGAHMTDVRQMINFWAQYTLDKIFNDPGGWEVQNMLYVASMICDSARWRTESRGAHAREDYPDTVESFQCHDLWARGQTVPARIITNNINNQ